MEIFMNEFGFILKKFITFFIEPYGIVFSLFFIGLFFLFTNKTKSAKKILLLSFFLLTLFSYQPFANFLISNLENQYPKYDYSNTNIKYIHVLGNSHNDDKTQPLSSQISSAGLKRNLEGIIIHKHLANTKIIFTGYAGKTSQTTAKINEKLALALGVKQENIIISSKPKDTKEEAIFTKTIVENNPFILVTSATHMPRAMRLFKSLGLNPIAAPTSYYKRNINRYFEKPSVEFFELSRIAIHEYIGILWSKLQDLKKLLH
jgi:uncharacterized SAM-binding protein YcdF (DUF218 family)